MFERRSLRWPITLGVVMIVLVVLLIVGWVLITAFGATTAGSRAGIYWALLSIGATLLAFVLVGVVMYLTLTIKAINLSRRQSNFIDSVTHELKSPIASLKLYLQTLNRRQVSPAEQENFYRYMLEDVERLDTLINHLLDAARLEKPTLQTEVEDIELTSTIRSISEQVALKHRAPLDVIQLQMTPVLVTATRVDLDLILRNLIDNAVKYASDSDPQVLVSTAMEGDSRVLIRVSDNGRGIPQPLRRKIFARFVRVGSELERDKPGTGLGLYIVRTLVVRCGGRIRIRDGLMGSGTTFEVVLPGQLLPDPPKDASVKEGAITAATPEIGVKS
ncbi:histidine kinase [Pirellula staleyi DSM 6068]|uniref:histidine kinase n=1 Tax=Pirellula staleyi (strain ATCC 27377 / DSM 6068 / ICPB 4128) TaxID=530564 RepID=D2QYN9_PIRSD|nr:HAMP domain-containing sensor histidine kinase [Pirellula staleyi]ADB18198.1 histidine kinase [Pirellula staleyi DSM 6068]